MYLWIAYNCLPITGTNKAHLSSPNRVYYRDLSTQPVHSFPYHMPGSRPPSSSSDSLSSSLYPSASTCCSSCPDSSSVSPFTIPWTSSGGIHSSKHSLTFHSHSQSPLGLTPVLWSSPSDEQRDSSSFSWFDDEGTPQRLLHQKGIKEGRWVVESDGFWP